MAFNNNFFNSVFSKKSQGAVEFMIILIFVFVIISIVMYISGIYSLDLSKKQNRAEVDDFAKSIISEFELYQKVDGGYERVYTIPVHLVKRFNITFNSSYLIIQDIESYGDNSEKYYYILPGTFNYSVYNDTYGNYYLKFKKEKVPETNILVLN